MVHVLLIQSQFSKVDFTELFRHLCVSLLGPLLPQAVYVINNNRTRAGRIVQIEYQEFFV